MYDWQERTAMLVGEEMLEHFRNSTVAVIGVGGVGGYAAEMIVRAGIGHLIILDSDDVSVTNKNRQLLALDSTVGKPKCDVLASRLKDINPELDLIVIKEYLSEALGRYDTRSFAQYGSFYFIDKNPNFEDCLSMGFEENLSEIQFDYTDEIHILNKGKEQQLEQVGAPEVQSSWFNPVWIRIKVPKVVVNNYNVLVKDLKSSHYLKLTGEELVAGYFNGKVAKFRTYAELFSDEIMNYFMNEVTPNKFRLEIGVQSLMDEAIKAVNRKQDNKRIVEIINNINQAGRVVIHVDLIAGLPYETLDDFKQTFNKTFLLLCDELQLGFLKLLRGTQIRNEAEIHNYKFTKCAPYEVRSNTYITEGELNIIHDCENALEWLWNHKRAYNFMNHLIKDNVINNYFDFFVGFNKYYDKTKQLYENYAMLLKYLQDINIIKQEYIDDLKLDYLTHLKIKPKPFWNIDNNLDYYKKQLGYENTNYFITPYYDKHIVIKYEKGKQPILVIE